MGTLAQEEKLKAKPAKPGDWGGKVSVRLGSSLVAPEGMQNESTPALVMGSMYQGSKMGTHF